MEKVKKIKQLLRNLADGGVYLGYDYTSSGIFMLLENEDYLIGITKGLYFDLATRYETSVDCIERDIRTLIKAIWRKGKKSELIKIAGRELKKCPTNKEFLDIIACYLAAEFEKRE